MSLLLFLVLLQLGNVASDSSEFFFMVYSMSPEELANNLTKALHSSEDLFEYKLYRSPSLEGVGFIESLQLCRELGSYPAIILSEDQHAKVLNLLDESNIHEAWTGLEFLDTGEKEGLVWNTVFGNNFPADNFFLNNLPTSESNGYFMSNDSIKEISQDEMYSGEIIDDLVEPGTNLDGTISPIYFTILRSGDYQPQTSKYLAQAFVCSNYTGGQSSTAETDEAYSYGKDELIAYDLIHYPDNISYHIVLPPAPFTAMTLEEAIQLCEEKNMLLGIFVYEYQNYLAQELMLSSGIDTAWIGLAYRDGQYMWPQIDLVLNRDNFFVNNFDSIATENQTNIHFVINQGLWKSVDTGFLAPAAVCMSHTSLNQSEELTMYSKKFIDMYVDWLVRDHFSSINVYVVGNGTRVPYSEVDAVCAESSLTPALLLTEEINTRAYKLMADQGVSDAWIDLFYNHTSKSFAWATAGISFIDASRYFLNNIEAWNCSDCFPYQEFSPVVLQGNGSWKIVDQQSTAQAAVCMGNFEMASEIGLGSFLINGIPEVLGFEVFMLDGPVPVETAYGICDYDTGHSPAVAAPVVNSFILSKVFGSLKEYAPHIPSYAWTGLVYNMYGFQAFFYESTINMTLNVSNLDESSYTVMKMVDSGLMNSAPVAISDAGLLVVMFPGQTLDAIVCCTVNLDRLTSTHDAAPKALTITGAELDQPKKIGRGKYSNAEDCINDVSTFAQLAARHNWVTVSLRKRAQILKVELYAPSDGPETDLTTMENANIFVATPRAAYCGIADKTTKMPVMVNGVERVRYLVTCKKYKDPLTLVGDAVKIQSSSANMKVARIVVFGVETKDDTVDFEFEEREFRTAKTLAPTEEPYNDETNKILEEPKFETSSEGVEIVKISIEEDVPYQVIEKIVEQPNATKTPLGYLAFAGYVDYSLDEETKESEEADPSVKERTTFNEDNLQTAIQSFLRFNGFVENGEISKEMVGFMQKDRCGNPDLVSNPNGDRCTTRRSVLSKPAVRNTAAFTMPGDKDRAEIVAEAESYYLELDIKFNDVRNGRSRSIFLGFNYDVLNANGHDTPLEVVALRFMRMKLCAQFLTVLEGQFLTPLVSTKTVLESCYTPTEDETKTFSFKARLDVYKHIGGLLEKVAVSIKGKEIASNVHKTPLFSSVAIMHRDDHSITMARLCKRWNLSSGYKKPVKRSRRKRFTLSNHKWGIAENTMRFNFQNYSTNLGPDGTRQGVLNALNLYSQSTGFSFQEVLPTATAEIVFMFVRDRHADGKTFHGAGVEKAHAYSPTHSEIHFNDYQTFSMNDGDKATSIFYVATHEIGHALGLLHSQQEDAVMQPGYPSNAFDLMELHDDDIRAVQTLYPELSGVGALEKLRVVEGKHSYTPKSPYPTECHSQIDAALLVKDFAYIISGPFIWRMRMTSDGWEPFDNYPKRVTDVFQQTYGAVEALFKTESGDSITVFALFGGDMISKYRIIPRDGNAEPIVILLDAKTKRRDFLSKQSILIDENIRSAFTYNDKTILVADNLEQYFEVSWMFNKKGAVKGVKEIISNNDMNSLIGRKLQKVHFNAAMTIEQNVDGETREMIYMFGASFVYVENPFPSTSSKAKYWFKVPNHFKVAGWCPARD